MNSLYNQKHELDQTREGGHAPRLTVATVVISTKEQETMGRAPEYSHKRWPNVLGWAEGKSNKAVSAQVEFSSHTLGDGVVVSLHTLGRAA